MLLISGLNFNPILKTNSQVNNLQKHSINLHSQPSADCVSFGSKIPKTFEDQAKLVSDFIGEKVSHDMGWCFKSAKEYTIDELDAISRSAVEKTISLQEKIGSYTKREQVGECIETAYDYLLKTDNDWPVFYKEPAAPHLKSKFMTFALPPGDSDLVEYDKFSPAMRKHLNRAIDVNKGEIIHNSQKYLVHRAYMSNATMPDEFIGYEIGLAKNSI